ncbi:HNH endonuclease [Odoribacter sp. OF09-27XD]|jgi:hypothetical protein|nr:HNH endonuclease [Odoribacter sp. OF09-27XD]RHV96964.1 HNH endonuclease [Odoribacter sp. OF09-27XD]
MKNCDTTFFKDYVETSTEYKQLRFIQWFLEKILDDVYCDLINESTGELYPFSLWAIQNYPDYKDEDFLDIWNEWLNYNTSPRFASKKLRSLVLDKFNYTCQKCGSHENLQIDHIIPYSQGGKTVFNNLTVLCRKCNRQKSDKI